MTSLKAYIEDDSRNNEIGNISDLNIVSVNIDILEENKVKYPYKYFIQDGKKYRIPISVIRTLSLLLKENTEIKFFKVKKTGQGLDTRYMIIPLAG